MDPILTGTYAALGVILAIRFCRCLNDRMQSLLPAIYPSLKVDFGLSFDQVGLITLAYQITASLLQPLIGLYRRPTADRCDHETTGRAAARARGPCCSRPGQRSDRDGSTRVMPFAIFAF